MNQDKRKNAVNTKASRSNKAGKQKKKKKHPRLSLALKIAFLFFLLIVLAVMIVFYFKFGDDLIKWKAEAKKAVEESTEDTFRSSQTSFIYASNKKKIAKLVRDKDAYYLNFDDIPQYVKDSFVVTEDRDYYEHDGVNFLSTAKAAALLVESRIKGEGIHRGGSTITQQLARKVFLYDDQTYERKVREMFFATELEKKYTKDQILEFYINNVYFANGKYGIESASRAYFSKSATKLTLSECAFLCSIPNRPNYYDPLTDDGYEHSCERKERILKQLLSFNKITEAEYTDAMYEEVVLDLAQAIKTQDYMTTYAIRCATRELMKHQGFTFRNEFTSIADQQQYEKEYDELYQSCNDSLYTGGYRIYTSLSKSKQSKLQKQVNEALRGFKDKTKEGIYKMQGAATCIDNKSGFVVAIVGGRKQSSMTGYTLNRAYQSYRQPGSCFKPLVVYTPALERDYTPDSIVDDSKFKDGPKNSDGTYLGKIPLRKAVEKSKNVVAWRLFDELSPSVGLSYVLRMNFSNIVENDYYLASSLGGLTNGVTTVEMASAYATLENDGKYREPTCITKITDSEGNIILRNKASNREETKIYEPEAAQQMTDILSGVLVRGTGAGHALNNMACAGKTGTTSDKKDGWFCGYTPYYTTAVWVGYDSPQPVSDLYGSTYPLSIWENFMNVIHEGLEYTDFSFVDITMNSPKEEQKEEKPTKTPKETIDPEALEPTEDPAQEQQTPTKAPEKTKEPEVEVTDAPEEDPEESGEDVGEDSNPEDIPEEPVE